MFYLILIGQIIKNHLWETGLINIALIWNKQFFKNLKYPIFNKSQHLNIICTLIFYDFFNINSYYP